MQEDQSKETKQQEQIVSLFFKLDQIVQNQNIQIDFSRRQLEEMRKGNEIAKTNSEYTRKFLLMEADKGRGRRRDETMKATLCHALAVLEADSNHNIKRAAEKVFHKGCGYASAKSLEVVLGRQYRKILSEKSRFSNLSNPSNSSNSSNPLNLSNLSNLSPPKTSQTSQTRNMV